LPYIDEAPLYDQYNFNAAWNDPASNLQVTSMNVPLFVCPSAITERSGECDYGGNYGSSLTGLPPSLLLGQGWAAGALIGINVGGPRECKTPVRFFEFADGLSKTFLVLECSDRDIDSGSWGIGTNCLAIEFPINDRTTGRNGETILSQHVGGGLTLFGDGHVNFLSNSTDLYVLGALSTRAGHEVVVEP